MHARNADIVSKRQREERSIFIFIKVEMDMRSLLQCVAGIKNGDCFGLVKEGMQSMRSDLTVDRASL